MYVAQLAVALLGPAAQNKKGRAGFKPSSQWYSGHTLKPPWQRYCMFKSGNWYGATCKDTLEIPFGDMGVRQDAREFPLLLSREFRYQFPNELTWNSDRILPFLPCLGRSLALRPPLEDRMVCECPGFPYHKSLSGPQPKLFFWKAFLQK